MKLQRIAILLLSFLGLFFILLTPHSLAKEPSVIWQGKLTNKSMVMDGATTSNNETLLATYTTKKDVNHYEIFKVNNQTAKVKNLSKLEGGEIAFFDFKNKGYVVHREKRAITIYDENFKSVYKKTWKSHVIFYDFPIWKSKVDDNLIAVGEDGYNYATKQYEPLTLILKLDNKGKFVEVPKGKLPGEYYLLKYNLNSKKYVITQNTLIHSDTNFDLELDTSAFPNLRNGSRMSFSSFAVIKQKNHFYLILRENERGEGAELLLKVNNKGKVVDYLELPGGINLDPEPKFMNSQVVLSSYSQEGGFYHIVSLDNFSMNSIAENSPGRYSVLNDELYYLPLAGEYQFFNNRNQLLYALPKPVYASENGKYGIAPERNLASSTVYDLKTGATLAVLNTDQVTSFDDKLLAVEQKSGYKESKLYRLK